MESMSNICNGNIGFYDIYSRTKFYGGCAMCLICDRIQMIKQVEFQEKYFKAEIKMDN